LTFSNKLVIYNAKIHTLDPSKASATALAIDCGQILAIGLDDEIRSAFGLSRAINANGQTIIPGLTDAHIHLQDYAFSQEKINCETPTQAECLQRVAARANTAHPGAWVMGHGWNQNIWPEGYGTALQIDQVSTQNPVYLTHKSMHSAWVNSLALQLAGIDRNTLDPAGGRIGHLENGEPDGILYESAANLVESIIPEPSLDQVVQTFRKTLPRLWKMGLTGIHDFDRSHCFSALQVLHQEGELKLRVVKGIPFENLADAIAMGLRTGFGDVMLRVGPVKLFVDGALGPHTAAMILPYQDEAQNSGILKLEAGELLEIGRRAVANGISLAVHAIGDRANREVLNAYEQLRQFEKTLPSYPSLFHRHRIEHVQVLHPDDIQRFSELDIIASMQPIHATSDMLMADHYWGKRSVYAYAWHSLISQGTTLIFGSDAPVESPNPFWGIHAAVTRRRADGSPTAEGWYPEQRIDVLKAIQAYTVGPAYASGMENQLGKLAPGYLADLVITDQDPFSCPPEELMNIHPVATMVAGEWLYSALE